MKRIQQGFTLIELMIVVAIIGILAAVAIPAYQDYIVKSKLSKVQSTLDPVKLALAMYYQENGGFPSGTIGSQGSGTFWTSIGLTAGVVVPDVVSNLAADGTNQTSVKLTLTLTNIKAKSIDGLNLDIWGVGGTGVSALQWYAGTGGSTAGSSNFKSTGVCAGSTPVTDAVAKAYFKC